MEKNDQFRNDDKEPIIDELLPAEERKVKTKYL
jgi:hypothetical protein